MHTLPEITALDMRQNIIRIPSELDVPLTPRVRRILDTAEFQRLRHVSQLGLVAQVYPGAVHSRFEHSLGVYRLAVLLVKRMGHDRRFAEIISRDMAETFLLAALLHDLGHFPFCHPVEDMRLPEVVPHEAGLREHLENVDSGISRAIREDWRAAPADVLAILEKTGKTPALKLLASMMSGPVDIDKMDYLYRDSLHAGVPYGRNFDQERLLGSLCLNAAGDALAISSKGKTAAELMVFARYVMFSEVYWHHAVRSATAMFQRLYFEIRRHLSPEEAASFYRKLTVSTEAHAVRTLRRAIRPHAARTLWAGLFGQKRTLYKQVGQYSVFEHPEVYRRYTRRPYADLVRLAVRFAEALSSETGQKIHPHEVILDAPPMEREVEFVVDIFYAKNGTYFPFSRVSPVVRALAVEQFDDIVKRVRLFLHPRCLTLPGVRETDFERLLALII